MNDHRPIYPIPSSSEDSSGVPQWRQITAEQSPQISGSLTSTAQTGQYNAAVGFRSSGAGFEGISMSMNYEHETVAQFSDVFAGALLRRLPQDQVALRRRQGEGKLPDLIFHPNAQNKIFPLLPRADPLVAGPEEDPAMGFGIAGIQRGGLEALRTQKLDE
ncbi:MAG TPA: hypothetical protein VKD23_02510, partial [Terriglobales bacterium]|nr:hypothetical protein [Terriglobales bacterium]